MKGIFNEKTDNEQESEVTEITEQFARNANDAGEAKNVNKDAVSDLSKQLKKHKRRKITLLVIMAVLLGLLVYVGVFIYRTVYNPIAAFESAPSITARNDQNPMQSPLPDSVVQTMKGRVNILVMGMDIDEERSQTDREDFRADTILLVSVDFTNKKVDMITVPRDSYAYVKNSAGKFYKINSLVFFGGGVGDAGFMNACDTISILFGGIPINYYVTMEMPGLVKLVDAIGGVYYDVDLPASYLGPLFKEEGYQKLDGEQALLYCRVRKKIGTDVNRQERQQNFIVAILNQLKSTNQLANLPKIYTSLKDMMYTNLSFDQICSLTVLATQMDFDSDISRYVLEGEYHTPWGHSLYLIDQKKKVDLVKQVFGIDIPFDEEHDLYAVLKASGGDS